MKLEKKRHEYFQQLTENYSPDSICIPDMPMRLDNNCKEGAWFMGETNYGQRLSLIAVNFSKRLHRGNEYTEGGTPLGQLYFIPVSGGLGTDENGNEIKLPLNICYYTLIKNSKSGKSGSLINFGQKATLAQSQGYDYREVIWIPRFVKKSGTITNDSGQKESASWYIIDWNFITPEQQEPEQFKRVEKVISILQDENELKRLYDPGLERESICIDGKSQDEILQITQSLKQQTKMLTGK